MIEILKKQEDKIAAEPAAHRPARNLGTPCSRVCDSATYSPFSLTTQATCELPHSFKAIITRSVTLYTPSISFEMIIHNITICQSPEASGLLTKEICYALNDVLFASQNITCSQQYTVAPANCTQSLPEPQPHPPPYSQRWTLHQSKSPSQSSHSHPATSSTTSTPSPTSAVTTTSVAF